MYLMYADESGDSGLVASPTRYFILTGLVIHELRWHEALNRLVSFRQRLRSAFGLLMREEIHAGGMLTRPGPLVRIRRNDRLSIIRHLLDALAGMDYLSIINVRVDKVGKPADYDPFDKAWQALIQRFENTLNHRNFPGPANADDKGLIFCDETDHAALRRLYRKMRVYNPVPHQRVRYGGGYHQLPLSRVLTSGAPIIPILSKLRTLPPLRPTNGTPHRSSFGTKARETTFAVWSPCYAVLPRRPIDLGL